MDQPDPTSAAGEGALHEEPDEAAPAARRRVPPLWLVTGSVLLLAVLLRPQQLLTTLTSPRSLLLLLGVVLLSLLLRRATRSWPRPLAAAVAALPGLLVLLVVVVPTVRGTSVDEGLDGLEDLRGEAVAAGQPDQPSAGPRADQPAAAAPVRVASAGIDGIGHRASGTASLVRLPAGALVVRLEDLEVDPGPDYRLVLVPGAGQESPGEDGQELGRLKATSGNQNYALEQAPPGQPFTVLIWCEAFSVPVAGATLR